MAKARGAKKASKTSARAAMGTTTVATSKPDREFDVISQTATNALSLANEHRADIEPRLPAGLLDGLASDIRTLQTLVPGAITAHQSSKVATMTRNQALDHAHDLITAMRQAIQRNRLPVDVQRAYGVGAQLHKSVVKSVTSALDAIINRAHDKPEEARSAGILADDVARLVETEAAIVGAGSTQRQKRAAAPVTTAVRNQTARRVILAIDQIAAAGALSAAHDPTVRAQFEALIAAGAKNHHAKKKSDATKTA